MIFCSTYGPMSKQRCVDNQLSIYDFRDFCGACEEGVRIGLPTNHISEGKKPRRKLPKDMTPAVAHAMGLI